MSLLLLRDSIKDALKEGVKDFAEVYTHGGRVDLEELKRYALKAPCAIVAPLGIRRGTEEGNTLVADVVWGCYLLAKDSKAMLRNDWALMLLELAMSVIKPSQRWGDDAAEMIKELRAENLFSGSLDQLAVSLWVVTWAQGYDFNRFDSDTLDDFLTYKADYNLAEADDDIDAQDSVTLEGP